MRVFGGGATQPTRTRSRTNVEKIKTFFAYNFLRLVEFTLVLFLQEQNALALTLITLTHQKLVICMIRLYLFIEICKHIKSRFVPFIQDLFKPFWLKIN